VGKILDSLKSVKAFVLRDIDLKRIITNPGLCTDGTYRTFSTFSTYGILDTTGIYNIIRTGLCAFFAFNKNFPCSDVKNSTCVGSNS